MEVRATEEGESEGRPGNRADTGYAGTIGYITGLRKQADFLLVFPTRKLEQPAYEAKQMTTAKTAGLYLTAIGLVIWMIYHYYRQEAAGSINTFSTQVGRPHPSPNFSFWEPEA